MMKYLVLIVVLFFSLQVKTKEIFLHCKCIGQQFESKNYPNLNYSFNNCDDSLHIRRIPTSENIIINKDEKFISGQYIGTKDDEFEIKPTYYSAQKRIKDTWAIIYVTISRLEDGIMTLVTEDEEDKTTRTIYYSCAKSQQQF